MTRKVLCSASFDTTQQLCDAIREYIAAYNPTAELFVWKKREVKGTQIKNTIANLCNVALLHMHTGFLPNRKIPQLKFQNITSPNTRNT